MLLQRMEETVAEGVIAAGARGAGAAWAVLGSDWTNYGAARDEPPSNAYAAHAPPVSALNRDEATPGPRCYQCGQRGHIMRDCRQQRSGRGADVGNADMARKLDDILKALRDLKTSQTGK